MSDIDILVSLCSKWIEERDSYSPFSREAIRLHFGIYALDEAIHSLEQGKVWRYDGALELMLHRDEGQDPAKGK